MYIAAVCFFQHVVKTVLQYFAIRLNKSDRFLILQYPTIRPRCVTANDGVMDEAKYYY